MVKATKNTALRSLLGRGVTETIVEEELVKLLSSGRILRLKQGFDPSRPDIHLGHVVGLRKLRQFQDVGHQIVLIVGDWTAQIGDPSGASVTRPMLSAEEVRANAETYMKQFFKVVDKDRTEVRWQSEWYTSYTLKEVIGLTRRFTVAQLLAREDFSNRYSAGRPIALTELIYPLLQAYDSVVVKADVEFGGTDQKFNCLMGRELQAMVGQPTQQVLLLPLLVGTDGSQKMSKSLDNYIGVEDAPRDMYGKVMSVPDHLIIAYFELLTSIPDEELEDIRRKLSEGTVNPMELKKRLAFDLVRQFHSHEDALEAESHFAQVYQRKESPPEMIEWRLEGAIDSEESMPVVLSKLLKEADLVTSRGEARRLLAQGAIEVNGKRIDTGTDTYPLRAGDVIRVGKHRFLKIVLPSNANA